MRRSLLFALASLALFAPAASRASTPAAAHVEPRAGGVTDRHAGRGVLRPAAQIQRWHGSPISLSLNHADLRDVLRSFAKLGGFNLVLDPSVRGEVTVEFENVPWDQALYVILKVHGMAAEIDGRIWTVQPMSIAIQRARQ